MEHSEIVVIMPCHPTGHVKVVVVSVIRREVFQLVNRIKKVFEISTGRNFVFPDCTNPKTIIWDHKVVPYRKANRPRLPR